MVGAFHRVVESHHKSDQDTVRAWRVDRAGNSRDFRTQVASGIEGQNLRIDRALNEALSRSINVQSSLSVHDSNRDFAN